MARVLACCVTFLALASISASPAAQETPARGRLLIASAELGDPNFAQSVVLLLHYEADGALGLIINRPTWVAPASAFPELEFLADYPGHVYLGGPVSRTGVAALARGEGAAGLGSEPLVDGVYMSGDLDAMRAVAAAARGEETLRIYAGHALWGAGQLEQEIEAGAWRVLPARGELVFTNEPGRLWEQLSTATPEFLVEAGNRTSARQPDLAAIPLR